MDEKRNNRTVERRLKESLKHDRARIQVGRISHFGLLEMSRQRIRSSVLESSTDKCPHCGGSGHVRSVSSVALHLLRMLEEMLLKGATHNLIVRTRSNIALYVLNNKRAHLRALEERFRIAIAVNADDSVGAAQPFAIEKGEQVHSIEAAKALVAQAPTSAPAVEDRSPRSRSRPNTRRSPRSPRRRRKRPRWRMATDIAAGAAPARPTRRGARRRIPQEAQPSHAPEESESDGEGEIRVGEHRGEPGGDSENRGDGEHRVTASAAMAAAAGAAAWRARNRRGREEGFREGNGHPAHEDAPPHAMEAVSVEPELVRAAADLGAPAMHEPTLAEPLREEPAAEPRSAPEPAPIDVRRSRRAGARPCARPCPCSASTRRALRPSSASPLLRPPYPSTACRAGRKRVSRAAPPRLVEPRG